MAVYTPHLHLRTRVSFAFAYELFKLLLIVYTLYSAIVIYDAIFYHLYSTKDELWSMTSVFWLTSAWVMNDKLMGSIIIGVPLPLNLLNVIHASHVHRTSRCSMLCLCITTCNYYYLSIKRTWRVPRYNGGWTWTSSNGFCAICSFCCCDLCQKTISLFCALFMWVTRVNVWIVFHLILFIDGTRSYVWCDESTVEIYRRYIVSLLVGMGTT